ncbi:hypothetical protein F4780DRAFT_781728 [Xylariomycetidae sp. FL0641]|nr:hypothetical protein F4780DRAFT_781728 [Xylariomycetidae sp. FL0641]
MSSSSAVAILPMTGADGRPLSTNPHTLRSRRRRARLGAEQLARESAKASDLKAVARVWKARAQDPAYRAAAPAERKAMLDALERDVLARRKARGIDAEAKIRAFCAAQGAGGTGAGGGAGMRVAAAADHAAGNAVVLYKGGVGKEAFPPPPPLPRSGGRRRAAAAAGAAQPIPVLAPPGFPNYPPAPAAAPRRGGTAASRAAAAAAAAAAEKANNARATETLRRELAVTRAEVALMHRKLADAQNQIDVLARRLDGEVDGLVRRFVGGDGDGDDNGRRGGSPILGSEVDDGSTLF